MREKKDIFNIRNDDILLYNYNVDNCVEKQDNSIKLNFFCDRKMVDNSAVNEHIFSILPNKLICENSGN